jgi:hypothetical protein
MDLHLVGAVFERIGHAHGLVRELALLADRDEAGRCLMRHRAADDEAARLDARHLVDLAARPGLHQLVDRAAERASVAEQRGDVAEHDPRLGIVRDGADRGFEIVLERSVHGSLVNSTGRIGAGQSTLVSRFRSSYHFRGGVLYELRNRRTLATL